MLRPFGLHHPDTLNEVATLLHQYGDDAMLYAGGTELLLVMKEGLARPRHLIDLKRLPGLDVIADGDVTLDLGATSRHRDVEISPRVRARCPIVADVAHHVANVRVRTVGTVGGNLAFADPHSDLATLFLALEASLVLWSRRGTRELPLAQFIRDAYQTVREDDEVLTTIRLRPWPRGTVATYLKFGVHERPTLGVAVAILPATATTSAALRLSVGCVGPRPQRLHLLEEQAMGAAPGHLAGRAEELAAQAAHEVDAVDDRHGSAEYKRDLTRVFIERALRLTAARAEGQTIHPRWAHTVVVMGGGEVMGGDQMMGGLERAPQAPHGGSGLPGEPVAPLGSTLHFWGLDKTPQAPQAGSDHDGEVALPQGHRVGRVAVNVNGRHLEVEVAPHALLLDVLRDQLGFKGAKRSCDIQVCGACTVLVDGRPVSACTYLAREVNGRHVRTIEGLADGESLHPLQEAFIEHGAVQCGFCTSGMLLSASALLAEETSPTRERIVHYLRGNLCRCTGYQKIIDAIAACVESKEARR